MQRTFLRSEGAWRVRTRIQVSSFPVLWVQDIVRIPSHDLGVLSWYVPWSNPGDASLQLSCIVWVQEEGKPRWRQLLPTATVAYGLSALCSLRSHWQFEWPGWENLHHRNQQMLQIRLAFVLGVGDEDNQFISGKTLSPPPQIFTFDYFDILERNRLKYYFSFSKIWTWSEIIITIMTTTSYMFTLCQTVYSGFTVYMLCSLNPCNRLLKLEFLWHHLQMRKLKPKDHT